VSVRSDIAAVIPAAGFSRRMGSFKPLLPLGPATVIERVIATVRESGVGTIRVVVGWDADRLIPVLERCGAPWVRTERFGEGMCASVSAGVRSLPPGVTAFFLLPGDMPLVRAATLIHLVSAWDARPGDILYPCYEAKRGHPPLIGRAHLPEILAEAPPGGLREILARHDGHARELEVADPGILIDLDTPEDYRRWLETSAEAGSASTGRGCRS
jgi:molybdenum cofactor cytidylyltransferase